MSLSEETRDLIAAKETLEKAQKRLTMLLGEKNVMLETLTTDFGVSSISEAKELLVKQEKELKKKKEKLSEKKEDILEKISKIN